MSRSALQKQMLKQQKMLMQQSQPAPVTSFQHPMPIVGDPSYQAQQYYTYGYQPMMPGLAVPNTVGLQVPGMPGMPGSALAPVPYAPIPLTGDEDEDNAQTANSKSNVLPMYGNTSTYNINNLLFNNVMENDYFRALYQLRTYHEVIDEIRRSVDHVEPWQMGTTRLPSTAFCLLVKFLLMKLTLKQMKGLLGLEDCPYARAIGFLYLRYTCPPADLWKWFELYLEDDEEFSPGADKSISLSMGEYCIKLLTDMQYYSTTLPRIPVPIERKMKVMLLLLGEKQKRRQGNMRAQDLGHFCVGAKVRAIYSDEENEPAWYEAVIDSKDEDQPNMYWVTFPEYGNSECVDLGNMELISTSSQGGEGGGGGGRGGEEDYDTDHHRHRDRDRDRGRGADRHDSRHRTRGRSEERDRGGRRGLDDSRDRDRDKDRGRHDDRDRGGSRGLDDSRDRDRDKDRGRHDDWDRGGRRGRDGGGKRDHRSDSRDRYTRSNSKSRSRSRDRRSADRGADAAASGGSGASAADSSCGMDLMQKVLQSQRDASAAVGRNYGTRPTSYKGSLSLKQDRYTVRRKSPSPHRGSGGGGGGGGRSRRRSRSRSRSPPARSTHGGNNGHGGNGGGSGRGGGVGQREESNEERNKRLKMLKSVYGDASAH